MKEREINTIYIPKEHEKYNLLPSCRRWNIEMIIWDPHIIREIKKITNKMYHELSPYGRFNSYKQLYKEVDSWIKEYPAHKQLFQSYKESLKTLNNKDIWGIVKYNGESTFEFTNGNYYYIATIIENGKYEPIGIIDNEEYSAFIYWDKETFKLPKEFEIIIDLSNKITN